MRAPAALLLALLATGPAAAEGAAAPHAAWQTCLEEAFALHARLSGPVPAADAALKACRPGENRYLAALSGSPLLDEDDVARARPALLARARERLIAGAPGRSL